jgi:hypothetical protein
MKNYLGLKLFFNTCSINIHTYTYVHAYITNTLSFFRSFINDTTALRWTLASSSVSSSFLYRRQDSLDEWWARRKAATYTQENTNRINAHTDTHALSEIRTHDPSIRASEDNSCLKLCGHCDRLHIYIHNFFFLWLYSPIQALAASMKLSVSLQLLLDLWRSVGLLGPAISSSQGLYLYTNI